MTGSPLIKDIGLCILGAAAAGHGARALRQPPLLGYILAGVLLGPLGGGWVVSPESVETLSTIGLLFLLFIIGLEIDLRELARLGRPVFLVGSAQVLGGGVLGWALFRWWAPATGGRFDALYFAAATALSSTLIVVKLLHDKFEIHSAAGRLTLGILVLQDLFAVAFLAFQPSLEDPRFLVVLPALLKGALLVSAAFGLSRFVLGRLLNVAAKSPELVLLTSAAWCFAWAGGAEAAGLSREMGALIAGLSIAAFPFGVDVTAKLTGVRDFFVTLFFVSLGLKVPSPSWETLGLAGLVLLAVVGGRLLLVGPVSFWAKAGLRNGFLSGINLSQVSEFSLVILSLGAARGHVSEPLSQAILAAMIGGAVLSPYLIRYNQILARPLLRAAAILGAREGKPARAAAEGERRDIVLLGYFRAGRSFLESMARQAPGLLGRVLVVDFDAGVRAEVEKSGARWAYGDLAHPETLAHLGIGEAAFLVCSLTETELKGITPRRLIGHLKRLAPGARLLMAADEDGAAAGLRAAGADAVVVPGRLAGEKFMAVLEIS